MLVNTSKAVKGRNQDPQTRTGHSARLPMQSFWLSIEALWVKAPLAVA